MAPAEIPVPPAGPSPDPSLEHAAPAQIRRNWLKHRIMWPVLASLLTTAAVSLFLFAGLIGESKTMTCLHQIMAGHARDRAHLYRYDASRTAMGGDMTGKWRVA